MDDLENRIINEYSQLLEIGDSLVVRLGQKGQLVNHSRKPVSNKLNLSFRIIREHCIGARQHSPNGVFVISRNRDGFKVNKHID